jgi:hypothetical protein
MEHNKKTASLPTNGYRAWRRPTLAGSDPPTTLGA